MIVLGFPLLRNVQEGHVNQPEMLPPSSVTNWIMETNLLLFLNVVFQYPVNVALWGFPSLDRMEGLHWSENGSDEHQNLPGRVKGLQMSSCLSLPSSHVLQLSG